jgi:mRNA interferase MazF
MVSYYKNEVIIVRYPFSDLSNTKIRPAVVVSASHTSQDVFITPLTSKTHSLLDGEFILFDWKNAGLNVETAVKRGIYTIHQSLIIKKVGQFVNADTEKLEQSLRIWLGLSLS